jgi:hypothetical protein
MCSQLLESSKAEVITMSPRYAADAITIASPTHGPLTPASASPATMATRSFSGSISIA